MNGPGAQGGGARGAAGGELVLQAVFEGLYDTEAGDGATAAIGALVCVESRAPVAKASRLTPEGTPNYMPAEVIRYQQYSAKSDVWAVGLTILECLTGTQGYPYSNPHTTSFRSAVVPGRNFPRRSTARRTVPSVPACRFFCSCAIHIFFGDHS